ncbi:NACHT domain-containing protein [Cellulophaga fucicola]|uniref:NACHT domain-containing protein n=1 Tax=Cellulophaga fucicola TaxID=76595 RepID=A0A1K1QMS5_9FLAO|nr:NACHT domain-containing protein [Cellulophaga fucicola]SFW61216.1 NACHT domain-containing protein [Cellulophaga fucicola]
MEIKEFTSLLETPVNTLLKSIGSELKQVAKNRILEYQASEFKRNYFTKTLLHRSEPIKLTEFYQPLHIAQQKDIRKIPSKIKKIPTEDVSKLFKKSNYITLIGNAGSGKSTIVKYLFINAVQSGYKIPIKIELRYLNEYKHSFTDYIYNEIFLFHKLGFTSQIIDRLLGAESFVFFFDGYDEISSSKKEKITQEIDQFVSRFPKNAYLITSRPYTNIDTLPLFSNYTVCDLDEKEIPAFVKKQISNSEEELAEKIIKAISQIDNRSYRTFLSNPLLLSMFILTFQSYSEIPKKRSDFYKQVFDTLYSVHDSVSKLSYVREKISGLPKDGFEDILRLFSFISFFEEKFIFQVKYLEQKLNIIKEKKKNLKFDNENLIEDLQVAIGILNKEGLDYTFPHRSLQEYFSANYISNLSDQNKELIFKKIKSIIEKEYFYLINNHHFLALLGEQDYNSMMKLVAIPILESIFKNLDSSKEFDINQKYDIVCKTFLITADLMQPGLRKELIHDEFCDKNRPKIILIGENTNTFVFPKSKDEEIVTKKSVDKSIELIKKRGQFWIENIKKNIAEQEQSDADIIDII